MPTRIVIKHYAEQSGDVITRIFGTLSPTDIAKLMEDRIPLDPNPRIPTKNPVVKAILESLDHSPNLFRYMTKGILFSGTLTRVGGDSFDYDFDVANGGIIDGGHNFFAICLYLLMIHRHNTVSANSDIGRSIRKKIAEGVRDWDSLCEVWHEHYPTMRNIIESKRNTYGFEIPVEFLIPTPGCGTKFEADIKRISTARNNNVQLTREAISQHRGSYRLLELNLPLDIKTKVLWKSGDRGRIIIGADDGEEIKTGKIPLSRIVILAMVPFYILERNGYIANLEDKLREGLDADDKKDVSVRRISLQHMFSGKASSIASYGEIMDYVTNFSEGDPLRTTFVDSLAVISDLPALWDAMELSFEDTFNRAMKCRGDNLNYGLLKCNIRKNGQSKRITKPTPTVYCTGVLPAGRCETYVGYIMPLFDAVACSLLQMEETTVSSPKVQWCCDIEKLTQEIRDGTSSFYDVCMKDFIESYMVGADYDVRRVGMQSYDPLIRLIERNAEDAGLRPHAKR